MPAFYLIVAISFWANKKEVCFDRLLFIVISIQLVNQGDHIFLITSFWIRALHACPILNDTF